MPDDLDNVTREHILMAIEEIERDGLLAAASFSTYDIVYEEKSYPTELVISIASRIANGSESDRQVFRGGPKSVGLKFLGRHGFSIDLKSEEFERGYQALKRQFLGKIPGFSSFVSDDRYQDEERRYKDELVNLFNVEVRPEIVNENWSRVGEQALALLTKPLTSLRGRPQNLVGWRYCDKIRKLGSADVAEFGSAVGVLIASNMKIQARLDLFVQTLRKITGSEAYPPPAASRSLASFFLTLSDHRGYFFLKTNQISQAIKHFQPAFRWNQKGLTEAELYSIGALADRVFQRMDDDGWAPADLIDVQGFFWVATSQVLETVSSTTREPSLRNTESDSKQMSEPLNQILYGPPGTGKTYFTVNKALKILDPVFLNENTDDRGALKRRFEELRSRNRIATVTFHQSFSYEDFVEGIRASANDEGNIQYEIESGVFRRICDAARARSIVQSDASIDLVGRRIWKMSLGNTQGPDAYIYDECVENDYILLGWGAGLDHSGADSRQAIEHIQAKGGLDPKNNRYGVTAANLFINSISVGDLIVVTDGNHKFRAIGEVIGDYRYLDARESDDYRQARNVRWLRAYTPSLPREQLMNNAFSQMTLYELKANSIDMEKLADLLNSENFPIVDPKTVTFQTGQVFGKEYTVREATPDILRLTKPNGSKLSFDMEMLHELAELVRSNAISIEDIREKKVFEKANVELEKYIVHGYNNIIPPLVQYLLPVAAKSSRSSNTENDSWVLIIDEINRGNIANIFGELITVIEPSKRDGEPEATEVILPYSKEPFIVPGNLYIIGTMNTADRSLVHMDTALRRRFVFEAMMPNVAVLEDQGIEEVEGIDVIAMLRTINHRIELLYDREHTLGHSFFLPLAETPTIECLAAIFDRQVLPLLEEYFFEDWAKIRQVLGDDQKSDESLCFVTPMHTSSDIQDLFSAEISQDLNVRAYTRNHKALRNAEAYQLIYEKAQA